MIQDEFTSETVNPVYSVVLPFPGKQRPVDTQIQPWSSDSKPRSRLQVTRRQRVVTVERGGAGRELSERKRSMDQRLVQMYRKYGREGDELNPNNSRESYREKLRQLEKGSEFKQLGSKRQNAQEEEQNQQQITEIIPKLGNVYCCDYKQFKMGEGQQSPKRGKLQYKYNDKFQRMLKIKDKIRRKNSLAVSRQRQKYQKDYDPLMSCSGLSNGGDLTVSDIGPKAAIQRNKLKLRLRGMSKEQFRDKMAAGSGIGLPGRIEVVGVYSNAFQYSAERETVGLLGLGGGRKMGKMSCTLNYFNH